MRFRNQRAKFVLPFSAESPNLAEMNKRRPETASFPEQDLGDCGSGENSI